MGWNPVAEEVKVGAQVIDVHALVFGLGFQDFDAVLALGASCNLCAAIEQVIRVRQVIVVGVTHVIERAD